jgi:hypothetical protein
MLPTHSGSLWLVLGVHVSTVDRRPISTLQVTSAVPLHEQATPLRVYPPLAASLTRLSLGCGPPVSWSVGTEIYNAPLARRVWIPSASSHQPAQPGRPPGQKPPSVTSAAAQLRLPGEAPPRERVRLRWAMAAAPFVYLPPSDDGTGACVGALAPPFPLDCSCVWSPLSLSLSLGFF